jgi:hypothetical protein
MENSNTQNWLDFLSAFAPNYQVIQQSVGGNPTLRVQVAEQRISIIQEAESGFSFWIERYEGADGSSGDELVVDVGTAEEQQRLAHNVVEAFVKRRAV